MDDRVRLDIEGADYAKKALKTLDLKIRRKIVRMAVTAGGAVIQKRAKDMAPVVTGQLRRQIRVNTRQNAAMGTVTGFIKQRSTKKDRQQKRYARTGHLVIGGTKPHIIRAVRAKSLNIGGRMLNVVRHPGARPNPFIERAGRAAWKRAVVAFGIKFNQRLLIEIAKARVSQGG